MTRCFILKPHVSKTEPECNHPPPDALNVTLVLSLMASWVALLWWADQQAHWAGIGILFVFLGLTVYALLHDALHRHLHACQGVNDFFRTLLEVAYGGPFICLRYTHQGHHQRNRSVEESTEENPED